MTIPNLPTDSLYKFGFVGGIAMILVSLYILATKYEENKKTQHEIELEQVKLSYEYKSFTESAKGVVRLMKDEGTTGDEAVQRIDKKMDNLEALKDSLDRWDAEADVRLKKFSKQFVEYHYWTLGAWGVGVLGLALAIWCGVLWYSRVQRYLDIILKAESDRQLLQDN